MNKGKKKKEQKAKGIKDQKDKRPRPRPRGGKQVVERAKKKTKVKTWDEKDEKKLTTCERSSDEHTS